MRGRSHLGRISGNDLRNTPVYAGKNHRGKTAQDTRKKHPRVCGEELHRGKLQSKNIETPPWVRGRVRLEKCRQGVDRNTPVGTGKSKG